MRKGLSEEHAAPLEFRGAAHAETRARLTLMEANLLSEMHDLGPLAEADTGVDPGVKRRVLDKLAGLDD
ncbi:MAG: hypothetical protein KDA28_14625 [Phycisphaerales bacterium]|nr:hypothetical protein [Phycisphaerales bacterium]